MSNAQANPLFEISTKIEPTFRFDVDGSPYELKTLSHLTKVEEGQVHVLWTRQDRLEKQIEKCKPSEADKIIRLSERLRDVRIDLICLMTTLPREVADALPLPAQNKILSYASREAADISREAAEIEDDEEEEETPALASADEEEELPFAASGEGAGVAE